MWTILKVFIGCVIKIASVLYLGFLVARHVGSYLPTRDWSCTPCTGRQSLNHWATREVPNEEFLNSLCWVPQSHSALWAWWSSSSLISKRYPRIFHWLHPASFHFFQCFIATLANPLSSHSVFPHLHQCMHSPTQWSLFMCRSDYPGQPAVVLRVQAAPTSLDFWWPALHVTQSSVSKPLPSEYADECVSPRMRHTPSNAAPGCDPFSAGIHSQSLENTISGKKIQLGIIKSIKKWPLLAKNIIH